MHVFLLQPPKTKSKKVLGKSSAVVDGLSTDEMSKDQVRAAMLLQLTQLTSISLKSILYNTVLSFLLASHCI